MQAKNINSVMVWTIDLDDFHNGFPLISYLYKRVVEGKTPVIDTTGYLVPE